MTNGYKPNLSPPPADLPVPLREFQVDQLQVLVFADGTAVAQKAAELAAIALTPTPSQTTSISTTTKSTTASAILATGRTQLAFLELLAANANLPWSQVTLFHLDEYLGLDGNHPASFQRYLRDRLGKLIDPKDFHYLQGDAPEPIVECDRYETLLPNTVDLCCLGIGDNGHLAFNEPGLASLTDPRRVKLVRLAHETRQQQVNRGAFKQLDAVPQYALTLTLSAIATARTILCLATGAGKTAIVRQLLQGPISPNCPASLLRSLPQAVLLLDQDAAGLS